MHIFGTISSPKTPPIILAIMTLDLGISLKNLVAEHKMAHDEIHNDVHAQLSKIHFGLDENDKRNDNFQEEIEQVQLSLQNLDGKNVGPGGQLWSQSASHMSLKVAFGAPLAPP